ncbi:MAG: hypothetical protein Q9160_002662 [Pyrenula sp. 1 TL-2023]
MAGKFYDSFLQSDLFQLAVHGSSKRFIIHESLLEAKGGNIRTKRFKEGYSKLYEFEDTSEDTIAQFIRWAHTGDYPAETFMGDKKTDETTTKAAGNSSLSPYAHMYIFADTYGIDELKFLAKVCLTLEIQYIDEPDAGKDDSEGESTDEDEESATKESAMRESAMKEIATKENLIELFETCFGGNLPEGDPLLTWLGSYAAWRLRDLIFEPAFLAILPQMSSYMAESLVPAIEPPWTWEEPDSQSERIQRVCVFENGAFKEWVPGSCINLHEHCEKTEGASYCRHCGRSEPLFEDTFSVVY